MTSGTGCGATVVFIAFIVIGLLVSSLLLASFMNEPDSSDWVATPAVIRASRIEPDEDVFPPYRLSVEYGYEFAGKSYTSSQIAGRQPSFEDYGEAARALRPYPVGAPVTCFVDPMHPENAVLQRGHSSLIWMSAFPLLFVAVGVGGLYFTWRGRLMNKRVAKSSEAPSGQKGRLVLFVVSSLFFLIGAGALVGLGWPMLHEWLSARSWPAVEATVVNSRVRTHHGDDSTTYSVQVVYDYRVGDRTYRSSRYGVMSGSSSGRQDKEQLVQQLRPGTKVTAYVDPRDPTNALLTRSGWWLLLPVGVPGLFALVGAAGIWHAIRRQMREPETSGAPVPERSFAPMPSASSAIAASATVPRVERAAPLELRAEGRKGTLIFLVFFALLWNGLTWGFVLNTGAGNLYSWLFMVPFVLAGVGLAGAAIYQLLALTNPRPVLTLQPGVLRLGDSFQLDYRFKGRFDRITELRVILEAREEATYTRGTTRTTDKQVFREIELLRTDSRLNIERGTIRARVPDDTMHSLNAGDSRIAWRFVVKGTIERWPDVDDEFPVEVLPLSLKPSSGGSSWLQ